LAEHGWEPHYYQMLFLTDRNAEGRMTRSKHLVAGRRGGKTEVAAIDTIYYLQHPWAWWKDYRGVDSNEPLWMWELSKNHKLGRPALLKFLQFLPKLGLKKGVDFEFNKTEKVFEFLASGSLMEFKSAEDPDSLRGAGLHRLWMDEAAFIPSRDAFDVVLPSLGDHQGDIVTTTTPKGKNWLFDEFFAGIALDDEDAMRVEYTSIDNPHYSEKEWLRNKARMHPMLFKQEHMAAFDSMAGIELSGDWLHYYGDDEEYPAPDISKMDLYIGVDPAISQSERADRFVITLVGLEHDRSKAYVLEQWAGRIPFPDQVDLINQWYIKYRPQMVAVEAQVYQAALVQQVERLENFVPVVPIFAPRGKNKADRIIAMSPFFKIGKVLISRKHNDFIDEWISYDTSLKNPKDDTLDCVEIALRAAGALLPLSHMPDNEDTFDPYDINELARRERPRASNEGDFDTAMGADW
jgi:predicted phage terminase large subunit-like protein